MNSNNEMPPYNQEDLIKPTIKLLLLCILIRKFKLIFFFLSNLNKSSQNSWNIFTLMSLSSTAELFHNQVY